MILNYKVLLYRECRIGCGNDNKTDEKISDFFFNCL